MASENLRELRDKSADAFAEDTREQNERVLAAVKRRREEITERLGEQVAAALFMTAHDDGDSLYAVFIEDCLEAAELSLKEHGQYFEVFMRDSFVPTEDDQGFRVDEDSYFIAQSGVVLLRDDLVTRADADGLRVGTYDEIIDPHDTRCGHLYGLTVEWL